MTGLHMHRIAQADHAVVSTGILQARIKLVLQFKCYTLYDQKI